MRAEFQIDFMNRGAEKYDTTTSVTLEWAFNTWPAIYINGMQDDLDCWYIHQCGWSRDGKYRRVSTADSYFWVRPENYDYFLGCLKSCRESQLTVKRSRLQEAKDCLSAYTAPLKLDPVDPSAVNCFIADLPRYKDHYAKICVRLEKACEAQGGRCYKTKAKSAAFAVLLSPDSRSASHAASLRAEGYKVTTVEQLLRTLGVTAKDFPIAADCEEYMNSLLQDMEGRDRSVTSMEEKTSETDVDPWPSSSEAEQPPIWQAPPPPPPVQTQERSTLSKGVCLILCLLFGGIGIHRFYAGKVTSGVIYLVLFLVTLAMGFPLTPFLALMDFIVILCGGWHDKQGRKI